MFVNLAQCLYVHVCIHACMHVCFYVIFSAVIKLCGIGEHGIEMD